MTQVTLLMVGETPDKIPLVLADPAGGLPGVTMPVILRSGVPLPHLTLTDEIQSGCFLSLEAPAQTQVGTHRAASTPWM